MVVIYALASSEDGEIRYIGQTIRDPNKRLINHYVQSKRHPNRYLSRWINSVIKKGYKVVLNIVEENAIWGDSEKKWITYYRNIGTKLVNGTDGGDGVLGRVWSEESRRRASLSAKGKKKSEAHCAAMSRAMKGHVNSPESIAKQKATMKGRIPKNLAMLHAAKIGNPVSQEIREKISKTLTGRKSTLSPEARARVTAALIKRITGVPKSEETKKKISQAKKGKNLNISEESRMKLRESVKRLHTSEIRKKISLAQLGKKKNPESIAKRQANRVYHPWSEEEKKKRSEQMKNIWKLRKVA